MRGRLLRTGGIAILALIAAASCGADTEKPDARPSLSATETNEPAFPYPPWQDTKVLGEMVSAEDSPPAEAALDIRSLTLQATATRGEKFVRELESRAAPGAVSLGVTESGPTALAWTGGYQLVATAVERQSDERAKVTVCTYDTPGVFSLGNDGKVNGPAQKQLPYDVSRPVMELGTTPTADRQSIREPRWIMVDDGLDRRVSKEELQAACEPFKPDPFVQEMPAPTE